MRHPCAEQDRYLMKTPLKVFPIVSRDHCTAVRGVQHPSMHSTRFLVFFAIGRNQDRELLKS